MEGTGPKCYPRYHKPWHDAQVTRQIQNSHLHKALRAYAADALEAIRLHDWGPDGLPFTIMQMARITEGGMTSFSTAETDWIRVLSARDEGLRQLKTYAIAVDAMRADTHVARHLDKMVGDGQLMTRVDVGICFRSFLLWLLIDQKGATFDDTKFNKIYHEMEDYFHSDTLRKRIVAPLTDFGMEGDAIALGDGLSIERLSSAEREEFASRSFILPLPPFGILGPTGWEEFALEFYAKVPKVIGELPSLGRRFQEIATNQCDEAIAALRLFKSGAVRYNSINFMRVAWEPDSFGGVIVKPPTASIGSRYELPAKSISAFESFWGDFRRQRSRKRRRIDLALRRFNLAYDRILPEDRLIDYMVALEALLLTGEEQQELAYKLGLRGAVLLGENSDARFEIFSRLRRAYAVRSNVVHGGSSPTHVRIGSTQVPLHQFVEEIANDVRRAIKKILTLTESAEEVDVITAMDERLARGS